MKPLDDYWRDKRALVDAALDAHLPPANTPPAIIHEAMRYAVLGGILAGARDDQIDTLRRYGHATGLAFQIVDDLLDIEADAATLGKTAGKDVAQGKLTYPALLGIDAARAEAQRREIVVDLVDEELAEHVLFVFGALAPTGRRELELVLAGEG